MKQLLLLFLLITTNIAFSQPKDEMAVRKLLNDQQAAWNRGNIGEFMEGYWKNDSLTFTGKSGVTYGWTKTLNNYKRNYPDKAAMGKLIFTIIVANNLGPSYFRVIGKWRLDRSSDNLEGYFSLLFKKIKGKWLIIADHTS